MEIKTLSAGPRYGNSRRSAIPHSWKERDDTPTYFPRSHPPELVSPLFEPVQLCGTIRQLTCVYRTFLLTFLNIIIENVPLHDRLLTAHLRLR